MQDGIGIIEFDLFITPIQVLFFEKNHFLKKKQNSKIAISAVILWLLY